MVYDAYPDTEHIQGAGGSAASSFAGVSTESSLLALEASAGTLDMPTSFALLQEDDIWIADGSDLSVLGFTYPTRCAVMRLAGDSLLVWSPIALGDDLKT